jgi:hypothetical protein
MPARTDQNWRESDIHPVAAASGPLASGLGNFGNVMRRQ